MKKIIKKRWGLTVSLVIFIFLVMSATMMLVGGLFLLLHHIGVLNIFENTRPDISGVGQFPGVFAMMFFSAFLGTVIAGFFSKIALRPIRKIIEATHKVASGDFNVRLDIHSIYELEELSQSFNKMAHELSSIETLRSDFINTLSHEFKTPIVSIGGFAELLAEGNLSEKEQREYLNIIVMESERLTSLSTNVLNLTKFENLEIITETSKFRLDEQLRKAVLQLEAGWVNKNITIDINVDEIEYTGNQDFIQQVMLNLIDNAIKFTKPGGKITIQLSKDDKSIYISVKDDGIGMDEQTKERIFDKFYQGDVSRAGVGNGLGLSIVKRIIDLCGGQIGVHSEQNEGSEFIVSLPK
jgi:signal transduction histidine kinase